MKQKIVKFSDTDEIRLFVKAASQCEFDVDILYQHVYIDAKSFLGVLSLGTSKELTVKYFGQDPNFENMLEHYSVA